MIPQRVRRALLLSIGAALLASGCDPVARPQRPLPDHFYEARTLDGQPLTRARMAGSPWVINLWVPG